MKAGEHIQKLTRLSKFISPAVTRSYLLALCLTFVVITSEILFPFTLQALLAGVGITPVSMGLPRVFQNVGLPGIALALIAVSFVKSLAQGLTLYLSNFITHGFRFHIRNQLVGWLLSGRRVSQSGFLSLFSETTNSAGEMLLEVQGAITNICLSVAFFAVLMYFSPAITICSVLILATVALPLRIIIRRIKDSGDQINKLWERFNKTLILIFKNLFFIRIYGLEKNIQANSEKSLFDFFRGYLRFVAFSATSAFLPQFVGILVLVLICFLAKQYELIATAHLLPYLYLFFRFTQYFSGYLRQHSNVVFRLKHTKHLYGWWIHNIFEPERIAEEKGSKAKITKLEASTPFGWCLENISFTYPETTSPVFNKFSINLTGGDITVITGRSGRGKSTLINLLVGDLIPQQGLVSVVWDGHKTPVEEVRSAIQKHLGYVSSENFLFAGTVRENLLFGLTQAPSEREIIDALSKTHCEFLTSDPAKLDSQIGDSGEGLSIGQRQRLCLARALLRKPLALILDEATSNLDIESQGKFIETLKTLKKTITIIIITHRLELLALADQHIDLEERV